MKTKKVRRAFTEALLELGRREGTMMPGKPQPTIAARLIFRAAERTTDNVQAPLENIRQAEHYAMDLTRVVSRAQRNGYRRALRSFVDKLVKKHPKIIERGWGDYYAEMNTIIGALREAGWHTTFIHQGSPRLPELPRRIMEAGSATARKRAIADHLASRDAIPAIEGLESERDKARAAREAWNYDLERQLRIYSTELR